MFGFFEGDDIESELFDEADEKLQEAEEMGFHWARLAREDMSCYHAMEHPDD